MGQRRITREFRQYFEMNENKDPVHQNLWDTAKTLLRQQYRAVNAQSKKRGRQPTGWEKILANQLSGRRRSHI